VAAKTGTADNIRQRYWLVSGMHKLDALTQILEAEPFDGMIVFARTKLGSEELAEKLQARGFSVAAINGDLQQQQRERTIGQLKDGSIDILVATDVAARGLDVDRISHVINYDVPTDPESYVHRIGRTGRAGRKGEAILFITPREKGLLRSIERATRQAVSVLELPTIQAVNNVRVARFKTQITETLAAGELELFASIVQDYERENDVPALEIAAALAKMSRRGVPLLLAKAAQEPAEPAQKTPGQLLGAPAQTGNSTFRVEVGNAHGVKPGNLVGAIANESGLDAKHIGRIEIFDLYSLVELPAAISTKILKHLQSVQVAGRALRIRVGGQMEPLPGKRRDGDALPKARTGAARHSRAGAPNGAPPKGPAAHPGRAPRPKAKRPRT
jgi:ATP-dependent RNA helicase DeaD